MIETYYTPTRIHRLLSAWPALLARADACPTGHPDGHARARGKRTDRLAAADTIADLERALAHTSRAEQHVLILVMLGHSLGTIAARAHRHPTWAIQTYDAGLRRMATVLGWVEEAG